ncbi:hypothetical protein ColKHC_14113 [Colletotrichum higginsianum]|nr:hypothetical protein ColKHC_14113 [Colletotrichum higginsianum]
MAYEIDLSILEERDATESQKEIVEILRAHLHGEGSRHTSSSELADAIQQLGATRPSRDAASDFLWDLWMIVVDFAYLIPPDHP